MYLITLICEQLEIIVGHNFCHTTAVASRVRAKQSYAQIMVKWNELNKKCRARHTDRQFLEVVLIYFSPLRASS